MKRYIFEWHFLHVKDNNMKAVCFMPGRMNARNGEILVFGESIISW